MPSGPLSAVLTSRNVQPFLEICLSHVRPLKVGRNPRKAGEVLPDRFINCSGVHCTLSTELSADGKEYVVSITDHSKNGTFMNGTRIPRGESAVLKAGAIVALGGLKGVGIIEFEFHAFRPDSVESRYEFGDVLGQGAYGKVLLARSRETGGDFAIKGVNFQSRRLRKFKQNPILREVEVMKLIEHPNIIKLYDVLFSKNLVYMVMELAPYGSLASSLEESGLGEVESRNVTHGLASALSYLHGDLQVIHRDIKPENVLVFNRKPYVVKVGDFGLAKVMVSDTASQTICGTWSYMAPEMVLQLSSQETETKHYDYKVDSWSLGVMLYVMLTFSFPWTREEVIAIAHGNKLRVDLSQLPANTSWMAKDLLRKLLSTAPEERLSASEVLAHPWLTAGGEDESSTVEVERVISPPAARYHST